MFRRSALVDPRGGGNMQKAWLTLKKKESSESGRKYYREKGGAISSRASLRMMLEARKKGKTRAPTSVHARLHSNQFVHLLDSRWNHSFQSSVSIVRCPVFPLELFFIFFISCCGTSGSKFPLRFLSPTHPFIHSFFFARLFVVISFQHPSVPRF